MTRCLTAKQGANIVSDWASGDAEADVGVSSRVHNGHKSPLALCLSGTADARAKVSINELLCFERR